ncbi:MAG: 16S rRNA (guanine(527)-N(7))-methyltransferase RsmG [Treponema sp.]|nr:16S rRNA (guanine(527)-N(7))-methyltransferase RsmG [Treponema sp.]
MADILEDGLKKIGLPEEIIKMACPKLEQYINEIILYNSAFNLTNTSDHDELVTRHILDSLAAYKALKGIFGSVGAITVGDIGSGGGLPGIPLATCFPNVQFKLVERMEKRCAFLENCAALLCLKNVEVVNSEAERFPEESLDVATFRAFRPLDKKMTKTLLRLVRNGGYLAAYKAKKDNIIEEMDAIKALVPEYKIVKLEVPGLEENERNLVIIKKGE